MDKEAIAEIIQELSTVSFQKTEKVEVTKEKIQAFEQETKEHFTQFLSTTKFTENWELPEDYKNFLTLGVGLYQGGEEDGIFELTENIFNFEELSLINYNDLWYKLQLSKLKERIVEEQYLDYDTAWLNIGWWSDKNEYFICCDKGSQHFGKVLDCYDCTPWNYFEGDIEVYQNFADFIMAIL